MVPLRRLGVLLAAAAWSACSATGSALSRVEHRRLEDSPLLRRATREPAPALRREALRVMGRIQSASYLDDELRALSDPDAEVRVEAAFAAGQLGLAEPPPGEAVLRRVTEALAPLAAAGEPSLRLAAIEALGKTGGRAEEGVLTRLLADRDPAARGEAALALFRARFLERLPEYSTAAVTALGEAMRDGSPEVRWRAAYAFSRAPEPRAAPALASALVDPEPRARLFALRSLGQLRRALPEGLSAAVATLQKDPDAAVRREAVSVLGLAGRADLIDNAVYQDPSAHVRAAAAAALGEAGERDLAHRLGVLSGDISLLVRGEAILAIPKLLPQADSVLANERSSPHWWIRSRAMLASGEEGALRAGLKDPDPRVAAAAVEAVARSSAPFSDDLLLAALRDPKAPLESLGAAVEAARAEPAYLEALRTASRNPVVLDSAELRDGIVAAAEKILKENPGLSASWISGLRRRGPRAAGFERPAPAAVLLQTEKGDIELTLAVSEAPAHAASFLRRAAAGLYDGTLWHRVVSNFVVQGGDPRGSGWGDGGFALPDEINRLRFERGVVGMAKAGKDTGSCQLFITLVPTPHLDGRYTVFGRVTRGLDAVDRLEPGDRILRARPVGPPRD